MDDLLFIIGIVVVLALVLPWLVILGDLYLDTYVEWTQRVAKNWKAKRRRITKGSQL